MMVVNTENYLYTIKLGNGAKNCSINQSALCTCFIKG